MMLEQRPSALCLQEALVLSTLPSRRPQACGQMEEAKPDLWDAVLKQK